jgi:hypothetical protein
MTTTVLYRNPATHGEVELTFVRWQTGPRALVVLYPDGSRSAGREWHIRRRKLRRWLRDGTLAIEGYCPEWAEE